MADEYDENQSSEEEAEGFEDSYEDDDYTDEYDNEEYTEDGDEYKEDDNGGNDDGGSYQKRGHKFLFGAILFLMAAAGGSYFGLKYMGVDFKSKLGMGGAVSSNTSQQASSDGSNNTEEGNSSADTDILDGSEEAGNETESEENIIDAGTSTETTKDNKKITFSSESRSKFAKMGDGYLYITKDGAKYYKSIDNPQWNDTYTATSLNAVSNGEYAVIHDVQGRNIRLYTPAGQAFSAQTDGNIIQCTINAQGTVAVIEKYENDYKIQVFRNDGTLLMERFEQDKGVFPLAAALSDDGRILAVTYADTSGMEMKAKILLFYVNKDDSKNTATGDFYAASEKDDIIAPYIFSLGTSEFAVVYDKGIMAFDCNGNEKWDTEISNKITSASVTEGGKILLSLGEETGGHDGYADGTLIIVSSDGKISSKYEMGESISYVNPNGKNIVIGSGKNFVCITENGSEKWRYTATQDIKDIFAYSNSKALVVTGTEAEEVTIKNK